MSVSHSLSASHLFQIVFHWVSFYSSIDHVDWMFMIGTPHPVFQLLKQSGDTAGALGSFGSLSALLNTNKINAQKFASLPGVYHRLLVRLGIDILLSMCCGAFPWFGCNNYS